MSKGNDDLVRVLRDAVKNSGYSVNCLAQTADVEQATLCRFVNGKRGLNLETASKLAAVLGLALTPVKRPRTGQVKRSAAGNTSGKAKGCRVKR